jgi:GNAT superfamily N-acetyltransferase
MFAMTTNSEWLICRATSRDVLPVRHLVLRPGRPLAAAVFDGDDDPATAHFAAYAGGVDLVGVASVYRRAMPDMSDDRAWQLRGMAVLDAWQRRGIGARLLEACCAHVAAGGGCLWCNARVGASSFYVRHGFEVISAEFDIPDVGPHVVMRRFIPAGEADRCSGLRTADPG